MTTFPTILSLDRIKKTQLHNRLNIHVNRFDASHTHRNRKIIPELSHLNYSLIACETPSKEILRRTEELRIKAGRRKFQDNSRLAGEYCVGSTKEFFQYHDHRAFFEDALQFFIRRHGRENIVMAVVHRDEPNMHMHVIVLPVTKDGIFKWELVFPRKSFAQLHDSFQKEVGSRWDLRRSMPQPEDPGQREPHRSMPAYTAAVAAEKEKHRKLVEENERLAMQPRKSIAGLIAKLPKPKLLESKAQYRARVADYISADVAEFARQSLAQMSSVLDMNDQLLEKADENIMLHKKIMDMERKRDFPEFQTQPSERKEMTAELEKSDDSIVRERTRTEVLVR